MAQSKWLSSVSQLILSATFGADTVKNKTLMPLCTPRWTCCIWQAAIIATLLTKVVHWLTLHNSLDLQVPAQWELVIEEQQIQLYR